MANDLDLGLSADDLAAFRVTPAPAPAPAATAPAPAARADTAAEAPAPKAAKSELDDIDLSGFKVASAPAAGGTTGGSDYVKTGLNHWLFGNLLNQESGNKQVDASGKPITSSAGAIGVAQVMPGTAPEAAKLAGLPFDDYRYRHDKEYNRALGAAYYAKQLETFGDDAKALAAYNAGPDATAKAVAASAKAGHPERWLQYLPGETQKYVPAIMGAAKRAGATPGAAVASGAAAPAADGYDWRSGFQAAAPGRPDRTMGEAAKDTALGVASGIADIGKAAGDLYGLATGDTDNIVSRLGARAKENIEAMQSDKLREKRADRSAAIEASDGVLGKAWTAIASTLTDPALAGDMISSNIASMLPAAVAGRVVQGAVGARAMLSAMEAGPLSLAARESIAKSAAGWGVAGAKGAGALQQGASVASQAYEDASKKTPEQWAANPEYARRTQAGEDPGIVKHELALQAAREALPAAIAISFGANSLPGGDSVERALVGGVARVTGGKAGVGGVLARTAKAGAGEAVGEAIEEGGGQAAGNLALQRNVDPSQDLTTGVGEAAGLGAAGGLLLGGLAGPLHQSHAPEAPKTPIEQAVDAKTAALAPVAEAAAAGGVLSKAAMAGNSPASLAAQAEQVLAGAQQEQDAAAAETAPKADPIADQVKAIAEAARQPGFMDTLRGETSPADVKKFVNDLSIAQSPSTPAAAREQALGRLQFAMDWAGQQVPATTTPGIDAAAAVAGQPTTEEGGQRSTPTTLLQRQAGADRDKNIQDQVNAATTEADRASALAQAQTNREQRLGAQQPAEPGATGDRAQPAEPNRDATERLSAAAATATPARDPQALDATNLAVSGAMRAIEQRGGVASQAEADLLERAGAGRPFDRIDPALTDAAPSLPELTRGDTVAEAGIFVPPERTPRDPNRLERVNSSVEQTPVRPYTPLTSSPGAAPADTVEKIEPTDLYDTGNLSLAQQSAARDGEGFAQVAAPRVSIPAGEGTAQTRKRKETLRQLVDNGFTSVDRRADGFFLVNRKTRQEFKLDGPADAALARNQIALAIKDGAEQANTAPTEAQAEAGNYRKGRVEFDGLQLAIENPIGSVRRGTAPDGTKWETPLELAHYGDVTGTKSADGDAVDVYLANNARHGSPAFVFDQYNLDGTFDETKTVLGVRTQVEAERIYDAGFTDGSGPQRRKAVSQMTVDGFKAWANSPAARKPAAQVVTAIGDAAAGGKVFTINIDGKPTTLEMVTDLPEQESVARGGKATSISAKQAGVLRGIAQAFGKEIVFFRGPDGVGDGFVMPKDSQRIYLNETSGISPLVVFGHELTHQLKADNPTAHAALEAAVKARMKAAAVPAMKQYYGNENILNELTSDLGGDLMADPEFWQDVFARVQAADPKNAKGIIAQLAEFFYRAINAMTRNVRKYGATKLVDDVEGIREAFKGAIAQYIQDQGITKAAMQAEVMKAGAEAKRTAEQRATETPVDSVFRAPDEATRSAARKPTAEDLTPVAQRGARVVGARATMSLDEKDAIKFSAEIIGVSEREVAAQVREHKLANPPAQGWAPLNFTRAKIDQGKVVYEYQKVPYTFASDKEGRVLKPGTPEYAKRVNAVGKGMAEEVRRVHTRALAGDANAKNILAQAGWYKAMRGRLRHEFGGMGDLFADLLGATSPNTPVRDNWSNAVESLRRATRGDFDALMPAWESWANGMEEQETALRAWFNQQVDAGMSKKAIKAMPEYKSKLDALTEARKLPDALLPTKESGKKYGFNGKNVARAMVDLWRVVRDADPDVGRSGTAPKAVNFSGNLIGFRERATIDVWAARMLQRLSGGLRIPSMAENGVSGEMKSDASTTLQFGFGQDVFSDAVKRIRADADMKTDATLAKINDDDLQAVVWFVEKELWTVNNWTNAAGEGGSFELEANLSGPRDQARIRDLRKIADSSKSSAAAKAKARADLSAAERTVDRFVGGLSIQQSGDTQGVDFVPENVDMARLGNEIRTAVYESDDGATVLGSKALPTQGRYGAPERALDLEIVAREGYNPAPLWRKMLETARDAKQDSTFISRVLRENEAVDPAVHRPGVEIYFRDAAAGEQLEAMISKLGDEGVEFFTVIVDGRRSTSAAAGEMPPAVGVRLQYVPEFLQRYGFEDLSGQTDEQLSTTIMDKAKELQQLAFRIAAEVEGVSYANAFWYSTDVAFSHEYQEKIDAIQSDRPAEGQPATAGSGWQVGQPVRQGLAAADRQRREAEGGQPGGDVGGNGERAGPGAGQPAASSVARGLPDAGSVRGGAGRVAGARGSDQGSGGSVGEDLTGLPTQVDVPGVGSITVSHFAPAREIAERYMLRRGIEYTPPTTYAKVDPARAQRIADAYQAMPHDPTNPEVAAAYDALIDETLAQYRAVLESGLKIEFIDTSKPDPYAASPRLATEDVRNNNHMWVYSTRDGFGSNAEFDLVDNPLLRETEFEISGQKALANDIFRVVHDYFGHVKEGVGFRADGEENAWRSHAAMFTPLARRALTTETRGQNSWLNFGPYGESNRVATVATTVFADQKVNLLPEWVTTEGMTDDDLSGEGRRVPEDRAGRRKESAASMDGAADRQSARAGVPGSSQDRADGNGAGAAAGVQVASGARRMVPSDATTAGAVGQGRANGAQQGDGAAAGGSSGAEGVAAGAARGGPGVGVANRIRGESQGVEYEDGSQGRDGDRSSEAEGGNDGAEDRLVAAGDEVTRSADRGPIYFSQLERALAQVPDRLATQAAPQWALWLKANAAKNGVKAEELEWSGVTDLLKTLGTEKISSGDLAAYVQKNAARTIAIGRYVEGESAAKIAEEMGLVETKVSGWMKWAGVSRTMAQTMGVTKEKTAEALRLYKSGESLASVSKATGLGVATVHRMVVADGSNRSLKESRASDEAMKEDVVALYILGLNAQEAAELVGVGETTAARWVKEEGVSRGYSQSQALRSAIDRNQTGRGIKGSFTSEKNGTTLYAASVYELARMRQLEADGEVAGFRRSGDRISYGEGRTYNPDLEVEYTDGSTIVEEIKPTAMLSDPVVRQKAMAGIDFYRDSGKRYRIVTERTIGQEGFDAISPEDYPVAEAARVKAALSTARWLAREASTEIDPELGEAIFSKPRITGDSGRAYTPEQLAMFENIGRTTEPESLVARLKEARKDVAKKIAQGVVDQFRPIKDLGGDAYTLARLSKGAAGAFEALLHHGKLKLVENAYDADQTGGFIEKVGNPLGAELEDFMQWIAANRAEQLSKEDREHLFTAADIAAGKSLADGTLSRPYQMQNGVMTTSRQEAYKDSLEKFNEFNKNTMDMAEQSGLIDGEARKIWESEFYVPFYRVSEEDGAFMGTKIKGGIARQQAFKKLKGGKDKLNSDLLSNTLQNWAHLIDASAKNRAARATLEAAEKMGVAISAGEETVRDMAKSTGNKNGVVWYMDGGKQRHFLVEDPYLMTAINSLEYAGMKGPLMDALSTMKHWLTVGVTASPAFKVRNLIRDTISAIGISGLSYNPLKNLSDGMAASKRDSQEYVSALASGGLIRFGTMMDGNASERIRSLVKRGVKDSTILSNPEKVKDFYDKFVDPAVQAYHEIGNRGEEVNRSALYSQLRKQGVGHAEAALMARDLMDFSMQGTWASIRFLTQVVPFMNARLQGLYKLGRAAKEDPKRFAVVTGAVALFSIALQAAYGDDDDWKKREDFDRDGFWWFKFGGTAFRIPKPFEIGAIASLAERGVELMTNDEFTAKRFGARMLHLVGDNLSMNPVPQAIKPIIDVYANKDSFSGRPIESAGMEKLQSEYRFNASTSTIARGASTALNAATGLVGAEALSPVQIDSMLRGYFGWLGTFVVGGADMMVRPLMKEPSRPEADYLKVVTQGFVRQLPEPSSKYVSEVYDQAKKLEEAYATHRQLVKDGKADEAARFAIEHSEELSKYKRVEAVKERQAADNKRIRAIERSEGLSPAEKREQIQRIRESQSRTAQAIY